MDEAMDSDIRLSCGRRLPSRPTYVIPEPFYELLGESTTRANFVFSCKLCGGGKTISTYYRSRDNLRNHIRSTHPEFISAYDVWCSEHSRKPGGWPASSVKSQSEDYCNTSVGGAVGWTSLVSADSTPVTANNGVDVGTEGTHVTFNAADNMQSLHNGPRPQVKRRILSSTTLGKTRTGGRKIQTGSLANTLSLKKMEQKLDCNNKKLDTLSIGVARLTALVTDGFKNLNAAQDIQMSICQPIQPAAVLQTHKHADASSQDSVNITEIVSVKGEAGSASDNMKLSTHKRTLDDCSWGESYRNRTLVIRLLPDMHLKESLMEFCTSRDIKAASISTCVGSLSRANLRLANGSTIKECTGPFEIVSLVGTISATGCHLHISLADSDGVMIGGHLVDNDVIFTTAEVVLTEMENLQFKRTHCELSGWPELNISTHKQKLLQTQSLS